MAASTPSRSPRFMLRASGTVPAPRRPASSRSATSKAASMWRSAIPMNHEPLAGENALRAHATLRCRQPGITRDGLNQEITGFETYYRDLPPYGQHLRWWTARYSRGDDLIALREAFGVVVDQVDRDGEVVRSREGGDALLFAYADGFLGRYRD